MQIEIGDGAFLVDAALLGELLDVSPSNVVSLMRDLAITSTCEKGIDIHQNEFRLTFFHGNRRARLRIDKSGLCVPKIRFCNIGGEGRPESGVT